MYGDQLGKGPDLQIGTGLGMTSSSGVSTMVRPENIYENITETIDGVMISFQLTPGTEAPAEMNIYFPDFGALCMAENATHTMHNIQTLRGALVRDAHMWSKYLGEAITLFVEGNSDLKVVFASHHWPKWNTDSDKEVVRSTWPASGTCTHSLMIRLFGC
jgi:alkyl sulfatase BDS1-like metallo-beta-lactamase superfamily hydrolase